MFPLSCTSLLLLRKNRSDTQLMCSHLQVVRGSNGDRQEPLHYENGLGSVSLSAHTCLYISQSTCILVSLPICLSVCLSVCLPVCLSVCLLFFLSVGPSISVSLQKREEHQNLVSILIILEFLVNLKIYAYGVLRSQGVLL